MCPAAHPRTRSSLEVEPQSPSPPLCPQAGGLHLWSYTTGPSPSWTGPSGECFRLCMFVFGFFLQPFQSGSAVLSAQAEQKQAGAGFGPWAVWPWDYNTGLEREEE